MFANIEELAARTESLCPTDEMAQKSVAIIGLGSGGSLIAWWLAATGLGKIILVDPDRLETVNVWRHLCDTSDLGKPKVLAVSQRLKRVNPHCKIEQYSWDIVAKEERLHAILMEANVSLLIVATDTKESRRVANNIALDLKVSALYGACFENAHAGEIALARPEHACHGCFQAAVAALEPEHDSNVGFDYSEDTNEKSEPPAAGLGMSVGLIANLQSHIALWALREDMGHPFPLRGNYFLLTTSSFPIISQQPFTFRQWFVQKRRDCLFCKSKKEQKELAKEGRQIIEALEAKAGGQ